MEKANLKKDYFWNTLGVLFQNMLSPLLIIVITRINGIDDSGIFSFAFSVAILFWALAMWGGRTYQVSDTKKLFDPQSYVFVRIILAIIILGGAIVFCGVNSYDAIKSAVIISLVTLKVIESIADAIYGVMQTNDHLYIAGKSLFYKTAAGLLVFVLINSFTHNLVYACVSLVVVNVCFVVLYDLPKTRQFYYIKIAPNRIKVYARESIEIMRRTFIVCLVSFLAAFSLNIPRYYLDRYQPNEIGYFGIIAMPVTLVVLLVTFILQPNIVHLSRQLKDNNFTEFTQTIRRIINTTIVMGTIVLVTTYLIGVELLGFVFGADFSNYRNALLIITLGAVASALVAIFINMLTVMRRLVSQVYVLFITNSLLIILYTLFIHDVNLTKSVILFAVTTALQALIFWLIYVRSVKAIKYENT